MSSVFALFLIAIAANFVIIKHVPALSVIEKMDKEDRDKLEIGLLEAVMFTVGASVTLLMLYLFKD